jgi:hypothetical protein
MGSVSFDCQPIPPPVGSKIDFGAEVSGLDVENLTGMYDPLTHRAHVVMQQLNQ